MNFSLVYHFLDAIALGPSIMEVCYLLHCLGLKRKLSSQHSATTTPVFEPISAGHEHVKLDILLDPATQQTMDASFVAIGPHGQNLLAQTVEAVNVGLM